MQLALGSWAVGQLGSWAAGQLGSLGPGEWLPYILGVGYIYILRGPCSSAEKGSENGSAC